MSLTIDKITFKVKKGIFNIFPQLCKGCGLCKEKCPHGVLDWSDELGLYGTPTIEPIYSEECTACKMCENSCPDCAIKIERKKKEKKEKDK